MTKHTTAPHDNPADADDDLTQNDEIIGVAFKWSLAAVVIAAIIAGAIAWLLRPGDPPQQQPTQSALTGPRQQTDDLTARLPEIRWTDITEQAGIDFVHTNGAAGDKLLPETMGGGVAFLDYNNSGHADLLFINARQWDPPEDNAPATMRLYRNDGNGNFECVTEEAGLDITMYGMGVAVGDINNNGWTDVYITGVNGNRLLSNRNGRFEDVTDHAGVGGGDTWSTGAAFVDLNNNGRLDLFVCNYVQWSPEIDFDVDYQLAGIGRAYGPPANYEGAHCTLYFNNGDGTFTDVSENSGIRITNPATGNPMAKALAVMPFDFNANGRMDLYVANDTVRNFLFLNNGDGTVDEIGRSTGAAFDRYGNATGAMGVDAAHFRNDDAVAVAIGNFANEMSSFYVSEDDRMRFADDAITSGIGPATRLALTFGVFFFDYDLDGRLDYLQANGHIEDEINAVQSSQHYRQPAQLFWNAGSNAGRPYVQVSGDRLGDLATPIVGRGAAYADIDGDGDLDVILTQIAGPPLLLRNDQQTDHHWLRVRLEGNGETVNRDAIGATVELTAAGRTQRRQVMPTRSYLSQVERTVTFGLGEHNTVEELRIHWPDGTTQHVTVDAVDRVLHMEQPAPPQRDNAL